MISNTYTSGIPPRHAEGSSRDKATRRTSGIPPRDKEAAAVYQERKKGKVPSVRHSRKQNQGEDINDSAEAFIRKFRQELVRQKVEADNRRKLARGL